jgi:hypothetical protein
MLALPFELLPQPLGMFLKNTVFLHTFTYLVGHLKYFLRTGGVVHCLPSKHIYMIF